MVTLIKKKLKNMLPQCFLVRRLPKEASNCILLTFDDGPHPDITPAVLERLMDYNARAIFFIPGRRIARAPHLLKRIKENGHIIGNHTYIHSNNRQPMFLDYYRDLQKCQIEIEKHTGEKPKWFRPTGGRISFRSLLVPKLIGTKAIIWSTEAKEWKCQTSEKACQSAEDLLRLLKPMDIVLFHDDNPYVLEILDIVLPAIRRRGYDLNSGIGFL